MTMRMLLRRKRNTHRETPPPNEKRQGARDRA